MTDDTMWTFPKKSKPEIKKGDFVRMNSGFVGQVVDNQTKRPVRMVHVFGMAEETGSVYAQDMTKIDEKEFEDSKTGLYKQYNVPAYRQWSNAEMAKQDAKLSKKRLKDVS